MASDPDTNSLTSRLRSWFPFLLGLAAIFLLHLHLQNYATVTSDVNRFKSPKPKDAYTLEDLVKALEVADKEKPKEVEEVTEVQTGTDKEFLKGRPKLKYPPGVHQSADNKTKYILMWGEAYGSKMYGFPHGNER